MIPTLFTKSVEVRRWRLGLAQGSPLALVPTMGALHAGHEQLIRKAQSVAPNVAVSIFVNPLQFNDPKDLEEYPRTLHQDIDICRTLGVTAVFAPAADDMYPPNSDSIVSAGLLGAMYEGEHRPGHFDGVLTIVDRFFALIKPDFAVFGEKDYQQLVVIRQMALARYPGIEIVGVPTVRDPDGLAISSRNIRLSSSDRQLATKLFESLRLIDSQFAVGQRDPRQLETVGREYLSQIEDIEVDYLDCVDSASLAEINTVTNSAIVLLAATISGVRLVDNVLLHV
ncbi:MAG: pantoate--beta-alanine ligase [Ilumatobacteraceae bacterium]